MNELVAPSNNQTEEVLTASQAAFLLVSLASDFPAQKPSSASANIGTAKQHQKFPQFYPSPPTVTSHPAFLQQISYQDYTTPPGSPAASSLKARPPPKHLCTFPGCNKLFRRKHHLASHLAVHSDEKPFKCEDDECGLYFRRLHEMRQHMKRKHYPQDKHI